MDHLGTFNQHRQHLFSIAYNMLGSVMDSEDILQETFLRWQQVTDDIEMPKAYLSSIVTNLCINHLKSARMQREEYIGPWLPEPLVTDTSGDPDRALVVSESLSIALLTVLEHLSPAERAAYLLRQVFDYEYSEISRILDKTEANCRQLVRRARQRVTAHKPLSHVPAGTQREVVQQFLTACLDADMPAMLSLLADDCLLRSDGGGKVAAARFPLHGSERIAQLLSGAFKKAPKNTKVRIGEVNGLPGIIAHVGGNPTLVMAFDIADGRIQSVYSILNPDKLKLVPQE